MPVDCLQIDAVGEQVGDRRHQLKPSQQPNRKIKTAKANLVVALRDKGWEPSMIASVLGISKASVYRIIG